jgi:protein disulfide-isomerase
MHARVLLALVLGVGGIGALRADIGLDATYEEVLAEKGPPTGRAEMGDSVILRYPDGSIRLKAGKVVAVNLKPGGTASARPVRAAPPSHTETRATHPAAEAVRPALVWRTDYRAALAEAKEHDRHVFLFFTGSDWCGWCMRLQKEILTTPEFARYAEEKLVLVEVDFPREKSQAPALKKQNAALQRAFQIEGYPTVVVLDADGKAVGRLGYQEGGPKPFVHQLQSL